MVQAFFAWSTVAFTIATQVDCEHIDTLLLVVISNRARLLFSRRTRTVQEQYDFAAWRARFTFAWGCSLMVIPR
ncbi:Uncharacterised protein [Vibrio cholerae]|nr:Uncharacterised protein [Vibrio cholerae]